MVVFTYFCLDCGGSWNSTEGRQDDPVCRRCFKDLIEGDHDSALRRLARVKDNADKAVQHENERLKNVREQLANAEVQENQFSKQLLRRLGRKDPLPRLRELIHCIQQAIRAAESLVPLSQKLSDRVIAGRARHRSKLLAAHQRLEGRERAFLEEQGERNRRFHEVLDELRVDRNLLLIRSKDYKRGNPLDNFIRTEWLKVVHETFAGKCFLCGLNNNLTIDHLWLPKNEGGNFVLLVSESRLLISNLLLLCRSCNAAKGEAPFEQFFSLNHMEMLLSIHKLLCQRMMTDPLLRKIAGKWYSQVIPALN